MSQNPSNYMEGVPVKISEKYKPPPIITLPHSILHRLKTDESHCSQLQYDFNLERNVLSKIEQWKKVREIEKENRRERIRRHELERARAIEENQKQLLTAVSYPSAEELSSDEETMFSPVAVSTARTGYMPSEPPGSRTESLPQFSPSQQRFDTILMPTVVPETCIKSKINSAKSNNFSKINYSDFENDTSSPFDNIELKTINDLDILAQVLNVTQIHSKEDAAVEEQSERSRNSSEHNTESTTVEKCLNGNGFVQPVNPYPTSFLQDTSKMSYDQVASQNFSSVGGTAKDEFSYYNNLSNQGNQKYNGYAGGNYTVSVEENHVALENYHRSLLNQINYGNHSNLDVHASDSDSALLQSARSKSKSVPDILKELNDEIADSEMRRNKCLVEQTLERPEARTSESPTKVISRTELETVDTFRKLSPSLQRLVRNISLMGFPLERVAKIAEKMGDDDKKIFEHLIPLSELLDLGFEEAKISEALLKFDNNKEKALDFLIS